MKVLIFEGTVEEISQILPDIGLGKPEEGKPKKPQSENPEGNEYVSYDVAIDVLTRRSLSSEQQAILIELSGAAPHMVHATDLQSAIDYTPRQFSGMMGAFGRRVSHTEGYVDGSLFFVQEWDPDMGCWKYTLPKTVLDAMETLEIQ